MTRRPHTASRSRARSALPLAFTLFLVACGQGPVGCQDGQGCGALYEYPQSSLPNGLVPVDDSVEFRVTQAGFDFLQARLPSLVEGFSDAIAADPTNPAFLRLELTDAIELNASPRLALGVDNEGIWTRPTIVWLRRQPLLEDLYFQLVEGDPEGIVAHIADLSIGLDGRLYSGSGQNGEAACNIYGTNTTVCPPEAATCDGIALLTTVSFDIVITPRVGSGAECDQPALGDCFKIDVDVTNVNLGDFDSSSVEIDAALSCNSDPGPDCDGECSDTGTFDSNGNLECNAVCGVGDFLTDAVASLAGALESTLESFLDDFADSAVSDALDNIDGMPATVSSRLDLGSMMPAALARSTLDLGYLFAPTEEAFDVNCRAATDCDKARGMDINLLTGIEAAPDEAPLQGRPPHECVLALDEARFLELYGADEFAAPLDVALTGEHEGAPYHLGVALARGGVNQALFAVYNAGTLCVELDSEAIRALTDGAFPLSAGTVNTLTGGRLESYTPSSSPALIQVTPTSPPIARLGAGDESEGHVLLSWQDVRLSFYVYLYERYARVFAVDVDVSLELSALYDESTGVLELAVSSGPTLEGYEQVYSELLPEVDFAELLEGLVGSLIDQLLGDQLSFELDLGLDGVLSNATGLPLGIAVRGIETTGPSNSRERLSLYFDLIDAVQPRVPAAIGAVRTLAVSQGTAEIAGAYQRIEDGLEVLARVDGGTWYGPLTSHDGVIRVRHGLLQLPGEHQIELRARRPGSDGPWTRASAPAPVASVAPPLRLQLVREGDDVVARLSGSPDDATLEVSWTRDGKAGPYEARRRWSLEELEGVRVLSATARTSAGRVTKPFSIDLATRGWR